jgi:hypothetical protein
MSTKMQKLESLPIEIAEQGTCRELGSLAVTVMYPEEGDKEAEAIAKSVCYDCPVATRCLEVAIRNREHGVWGGHTESERKTIHRKQVRNHSGKGVNERSRG